MWLDFFFNFSLNGNYTTPLHLVTNIAMLDLLNVDALPIPKGNRIYFEKNINIKR